MEIKEKGRLTRKFKGRLTEKIKGQQKIMKQEAKDSNRYWNKKQKKGRKIKQEPQELNPLYNSRFEEIQEFNGEKLGFSFNFNFLEFFFSIIA